MFIEEEDYLEHYGILRRSGRYPWNSGGEDENTRNKIFLNHLNELKSQGLSEKEIAKGWDCSINEIRSAKSIARNQQRAADIAMAHRLKEERGWSNTAIGKRMGIPESTVRNLLRPGEIDKADAITSTAKMLKEEVDAKKFVDVGRGSENFVGASSTRLNNAVSLLREEGYELHPVYIRQVTTGKDTRGKILCPPGTTWKEANANKDNIQQIGSYSDDGGRTYSKPAPPMSISPKRVAVRYANEGGAKADGVIYVRPGVKDIELGGVQYAQVRVKVGDEHYLKGMAMYKKDLPDGVDLLFNTAKSDTGNKLDAMKALKDDPDLPFGSIVRQIPDVKGAKPTSVMNIVNDEGNWSTWTRTLSTQMLSKQSPMLAKTQLDMTYERRQTEYENIMKLTNLTVRKKMLMDFAGETDSASVHLKAAAMPGQAVRVILPIPSLRSTQVYAPGFKNGEQVVLVRHPHGGTFELPQLTVNNRHKESKDLLGDAKAAIGINHEVAHWLSGADFDGDTVLVIPNHPITGRIKTSPALKELQNFDPKAAYPEYPGMRVMRNTQAEMGKISNLITDMTIKRAPHSEIARAVKHSMVVIDAENHRLNHRLSANDNNIKDLVDKYQRQPGSKKAGASTLISRRKAEVRVPERKERPQKLGGPINKETGAKEYVPTGKVYWNTKKPIESKVRAIDLTDDAHTLSSGTVMEGYYADHSNQLKALANKARLSAINTPRSSYSASAAKAYPNEVASLNNKLAIAKRNAPLERQAQVIASQQVKAKKQYNPNMDDDTYKKVQSQALNDARDRMGAKKHAIEITKEEWDAIQAGAISDTKLTEILTNADMSYVRKLATPKEQVLMTPSMQARARQMFALGYDRADVAQQLGVSVSTLDKASV